jgi:hypothetical protein
LACQVQGSSRSSWWVLVRPEIIRSSTSVSHACGSIPFSLGWRDVEHLLAILADHVHAPATALPLTMPCSAAATEPSRSSLVHPVRQAGGKAIRSGWLDG